VYFARGGGRIVFGSDTPSGPTYANPPGYNGYLELRALEAAGLSPRQLLSAATVENARLFGLTADYGTIEHGKVASLLLLRENPLVSTAALDSIDTVILRGRVVPRATLAADQ
jgi:imidazolonepropionase-like amidohydrolase